VLIYGKQEKHEKLTGSWWIQTRLYRSFEMPL